MSKNFEKEKTSIELIEIPAACVTQLFFDVHCLLGMHEQLIRMYEVESMLKKHHKAYLHIREKADEMCRADKELMSEIADHYQNPAKHMDETLRFHNLLMKLDEECGEATVYPTEEEIYKKVKAHRDEEPVKDAEKTDAIASGDKSADRSSSDSTAEATSNVMVMMSADTLGDMQDDMIGMTVVVDRLVELIRRIEQSGIFDREVSAALTRAASDFSEEVFDRWDHTGFPELMALELKGEKTHD